MRVLQNEAIDRRVRTLLGCGIASSVLWIATDIFASWRAPDYSYLHQTVSELSAVDALTRPLWIACMLPYLALFIAFSWGVWLVSGRRRALRALGLLLFGLVAVSISWLFFPMHRRGVPTTYTDVGHVVLAGVQVTFTLAAIGFGAAAFGKHFRWYSISTLVVLLVAGAAMSRLAPGIPANQPTPWIGVLERVNVYGYMLWLVVLALALGRERQAALHDTSFEHSSPAA